jgi:hypothetical protein
VRTVKEGEDVYKVLMNDLHMWPEELSTEVVVGSLRDLVIRLVTRPLPPYTSIVVTIITTPR